MKVKELIKKLKKFPEDAPVGLWDEHFGGLNNCFKVTMEANDIDSAGIKHVAFTGVCPVSCEVCYEPDDEDEEEPIERYAVVCDSCDKLNGQRFEDEDDATEVAEDHAARNKHRTNVYDLQAANEEVDNLFS